MPAFYVVTDAAGLCLVTQLCPALCNSMDCSPSGSSVHGDSLGKNTGAGCHALLQRISPTQGLNPGRSALQAYFYHLNHQGSPADAASLASKSPRSPHCRCCLSVKTAVGWTGALSFRGLLAIDIASALLHFPPLHSS